MRDGTRALDLATRACESSAWKEVASLDTLAAACAETGRFDEAVRWQERALALLAAETPAGVLPAPKLELAEPQDAAGFRARLELYKAGKPFRDPVLSGRAQK